MKGKILILKILATMRSKMGWSRCLLVGLAIASIIFTGQTACGDTLASSTFDSNTDGWQVQSLVTYTYSNPPTLANLYAMNWRPTGGNPSGYAVGTDDNWTHFFSAPEKFLGDKVAAYGGSFSYDLKIDSAGSWNSYEPALILVGVDKTLYYNPVSLPSANYWTSYNIPLASTSGWHLNSNTGVIPTEGEMKNVLGNLQHAYIFVDWVYGYDTTGIDNVKMNSVPEPATMLLLGLGLVGLAGARRKFKM